MRLGVKGCAVGVWVAEDLDEFVGVAEYATQVRFDGLFSGTTRCGRGVSSVVSSGLGLAWRWEVLSGTNGCKGGDPEGIDSGESMLSLSLLMVWIIARLLLLLLALLWRPCNSRGMRWGDTPWVTVSIAEDCWEKNERPVDEEDVGVVVGGWGETRTGGRGDSGMGMARGVALPAGWKAAVEGVCGVVFIGEGGYGE